MESKLEQGLILAKRVPLELRVYSLVDLSNLSAVALYSEKGNKDSYIKGNDKNLNFYNWINPKNFGETDFYLQDDEESHKKFKKRIISGEATGGTISAGGNFSVGGGY
ncbi:MAG: hypothetical protein BWY36_00740 [Candidatus Diapherotrites archaeon ADurb.Bin253]|nr:MAG: hypothetical protein BWY36_00740 [Candidatus Diapherotrites archaeon ADurb.Bin253]